MPHANRSKVSDAPGRNPTPEEIKAARERLGLSQTDAAKLCYSTLRSWQNWEAGEGNGGSRMHPAIWEFWKSKAFPNDLSPEVDAAFDAAEAFIRMALPFVSDKGTLIRQNADRASQLIRQLREGVVLERARIQRK